jgi:hypothetical protein
MILATAHFRFADLGLDFGLAFVLALALGFALAFGLAAAAFFAVPPVMNGDGVFLPVRERLPSTERPPPSIIFA